VAASQILNVSAVPHLSLVFWSPDRHKYHLGMVGNFFLQIAIGGGGGGSGGNVVSRCGSGSDNKQE
jgi:hypothetical protein